MYIYKILCVWATKAEALSLQELWQEQCLWTDAGCIENFDPGPAGQIDGKQQKINNWYSPVRS